MVWTEDQGPCQTTLNLEGFERLVWEDWVWVVKKRVRHIENHNKQLQDDNQQKGYATDYYQWGLKILTVVIFWFKSDIYTRDYV